MQAYLAVGRDRRRPDLRRRRRLARRAPGAVRRGQRARRARADELPVVEPGGAQGERRRRAARTWSRGARRLPARLPAPRLPATRRHEQVRGRREPGASPRARSCCAPRCSSSSSTSRRPRRCARCRCCSSRRRSTSTTSSTSRPGAAWSSGSSPQGQQVFVDLLAQPRRRAGPLRPRHLRRGGARGARRRRRDHRPAGGPRQRRLLGRDHHAPASLGHLAADGRARRDREPDADGVRARQRARRAPPAALANREIAAAAVAESARRGYVDGQALAGVFTWLRPNDLVWNYVVNNYLLGKEPPAFDILYWNQDTRAAGGRPAPRLHPARRWRTRSRAPGALEVLGTPVDLGAVDVDSYIVAGLNGPHRPVGERLPQHAAARRRAALRALDQRPHPGARQPARRPTAARATASPTQPARRPTRGSSRPPRCRAAGGPTTTQWLAARSGELKPAPKRLGNARHKAQAKAPGTYVHAS